MPTLLMPALVCLLTHFPCELKFSCFFICRLILDYNLEILNYNEILSLV